MSLPGRFEGAFRFALARHVDLRFVSLGWVLRVGLESRDVRSGTASFCVKLEFSQDFGGA